MRKVDGWQTPATKPTDQLIDLAALAKPRTDRAELFAKSCRRQNGFS